jgi:hypothetical protein
MTRESKIFSAQALARRAARQVAFPVVGHGLGYDFQDQ